MENFGINGWHRLDWMIVCHLLDSLLCGDSTVRHCLLTVALIHVLMIEMIVKLIVGRNEFECN